MSDIFKDGATGGQPDGEIHEVRDDVWWITDEYLTAGCHMVARQFIEDGKGYTTMHAFIKAVTYAMRQHCPLMYSYFFSKAELTTLPMGTIHIILDLVKKERPLFMMGVGPSAFRE